MTRLTSNLVAAALLGQLVGLLGWVDALFIPLVLLGPLVTGALAVTRRISRSWVMLLWFSAGVNMAWTDWLVNREDVVFHLVLSVVMAGLAWLGHAVVRAATRTRVSRP
jgi:hypothetical protein